MSAPAALPICRQAGPCAPAGRIPDAWEGQPGTLGESREASRAVRRCRGFVHAAAYLLSLDASRLFTGLRG